MSSTDLGRARKVLVVEDELMVADIIEEVLVDAGFQVCGITGSTREAVLLAEQHRPDLAIVDVMLADGYGTDVASVLVAQNCGVLYTTGNANSVKGSPGHACLQKPFSSQLLAPALDVVSKIARTGATPVIPTNLVEVLMLLMPHPKIRAEADDGQLSQETANATASAIGVR